MNRIAFLSSNLLCFEIES